MESDAISKEEVLKIISLACLDPERDSTETLTEEMNAILKYVQSLNKLNVAHVAPMSHAGDVVDIFREDRVLSKESPMFLTTEQGIQNAPDSSGTFIRVPLVIE